MRNGHVSLWQAQLGKRSNRSALSGDDSAQVCVVGGGYTGLWTAYYLKRADPSLDVCVLEREFCGYGASGRNGGWLSDHSSGPADAATREAIRGSIGEVAEVCAREGIDCDLVHGGVLTVARSAAQEARLARDPLAGEPLSREALAARVRVAGARSGAWSPHCARIQPAKLVRGLADACERLGVRILERTEVLDVRPGEVVCAAGRVTCEAAVICLEGFTAGLPGRRRTWLPLNSAIVATEPLPSAVWDEIGWEGCELLGDEAHAYVYAQRTADGRIALGGRGVPYRFGSRTDRDGRTGQATVRALVSALHAMFPAVAEVPIAHAWCGVLGVPRDWTPTVRFDAATRIGIAGGYVGNGVSTTNLAGRTLAALVRGESSSLTELPWVGRQARTWEPEPLRWVGSRAVYGLYRTADRRESARASARTSRLARAADLLAGR